ncbi:DUF5305 domain-containing protein [Halovivax limisalsi]|uniref:DUF5305 domain-containing protein n=1 Tax=Halovivax limisalsi TaxID=1453760 RepID=UPI001FFD0FC0|nr:DUF5305 domain-containing protein [Halovivax limisalsi]
MIGDARIDLLVARYGSRLVLALAIVGVLALLISGWAVATPHERTTTQEIDRGTVETTVGTSAVVESDGLWSEGTVLSDEPVYLRNATSTLTLEPETSVPSEASAVVHDVGLRHEAVRDESVFWEREERIARTQPTVEDGVATSEATIDLEAVLADRRAVERQVGGVGSVRTIVVVETRYELGASAESVDVETELVVTDSAAWLVEPTPSAAQPHTESRTVTETEPRSPAFVGLFALVGTLGLGAAWTLDRRRPVDEQAALRALHERRYAEWISRGSIPMWIGDHHISLETLEDVVDVAVDTNNRVVHDRQRGLYATVTDGVVYYYTDRGLWEETAWPDIDLDEEGDDEFTPPPAGRGPGAGGPGQSTSETDRSRIEREAGGATLEPPADLDPSDEDAWHRI